MAHIVLDSVVSVHAQDAASLWETRTVQHRLPHVNLHALARLDERLLAHLDGLAVAGTHAHDLLDSDPEPSLGVVFASAVRAIEDGRHASLERLWTLASQSAVVQEGLAAALGWVERNRLQGLVRELLTSADPTRRVAGLTACRMHRVDPGLGTGPWLNDPAPTVRATALQTAGEVGLEALGPRCLAATGDDDEECRRWAAWSAVMLGNRGAALDALSGSALDAAAPQTARTLSLALQAMTMPSSHVMLRGLAKDPSQLRWLIQGSGIAGDPAYAPWLVGHMATPVTSRTAGEAFSLITGADLDVLQLWREEPEDFEPAANDSPDDEHVDMDPDEGLMWPDPEKVQRWWDATGRRFQTGARYFMGAPVTRQHCISVLKNGYQRQRILAAHYLCLLNPATPLFNTSAPAWRQMKLLNQMV